MKKLAGIALLLVLASACAAYAGGVVLVQQGPTGAANPGVAWPASGTESPDTIGDPFGHRTFSGHGSLVDFHRGLDHFDAQAGEQASSPIHGRVVRSHYTHFSFDEASNLDEMVEVDAGSKATFAVSGGSLDVDGKNDGTVAFPEGIARLETRRNWSWFSFGGTQGDAMLDLQLAETISTSGAIVFGVIDVANDEYVTLSYDGSTFTVNGQDAGGAMTADATTAAVASQTWMRIKFTASTGEVKWQRGTDGSAWSDIATEGTIAWTRQGAGFKAFVGWNPAESAEDDAVPVEFFGWWDALGIGRFGNWITVANGSEKWVLMHFRHLLVATGDEVRAGSPVGLVGQSGFDIFSGRILAAHVHVEYHPNNKHDYSNDEAVNPLASGRLPRSSEAISVEVERTEDGTDHILTITVDRGSDQNFQVNSFALTGSSATRTLNWNTRAGLDPADHDAASYDGVTFEPASFTTASTEYVLVLRFAKATVGGTFVSAIVKDTEDATLWSE